MDLLNNPNTELSRNEIDLYVAKLERLGKILDKDIDGTFYVDYNEVDLEGINNYYSINSIYNRLKDLQIYSGCKEV